MGNKRGGRRPGAGRKPGKVSAAKLSIAEAAREFAQDALQTLIQIARDPGSPASSRVSAANAVLDRGYGKPVGLTMEPQTDPLAEMLKEISKCGSAAPIKSSAVSLDEEDEIEP